MSAKPPTEIFVTALIVRAVISLAGICSCLWLGTNGYCGWPVMGMAALTCLLVSDLGIRYHRSDKEDEG